MASIIAAPVVFVLVLLGLVFFWNYWPLRKYVYIKTSPSWKRLARIQTFDPAAEAVEERNLFVSSTVMREACDIVWHEGEESPPEALLEPLAHGTVVHLNSKHVQRFAEAVLPRLRARIVLVVGCDTVTPRVPGHEAILAADRILHWFLQNDDLGAEHRDRVSQLPLGLDYHKLEPAGDNTSSDMGLPSRAGNQQLTLRAIRDTIAPLRERPARVYANFHLNMDSFLRSQEALKRRQARQEAWDVLRDAAFMDFERHQTPRNEVWRRHVDVAFEASPHGNGLDCHRTWEALLLKTVPIVKTSVLDPIYDGLPVVIVEDWREVTTEALEAWREKYGEAFDGPIPEVLFSNHWIERFNAWKHD